MTSQSKCLNHTIENLFFFYFSGMMIGNHTLNPYFDSAVPHIDTAAVWFVPTALEIAHWKNLTVIFDTEVWCAIFVIFLINGFVWWLVGRNKEKINEFKDIVLCIMGSFHILLQGSIKNPKTGLLRMLVLIWTLSCLLLFTAHQCQLTGILTSPLYEHQISGNLLFKMLNGVILKKRCKVYITVASYYVEGLTKKW